VTRYIALLREPAPLGGICPACDRVMDETGCRIGGRFVVKAKARARTGVGQIVETWCTGTATSAVFDCPAHA
jgi:hypothetical protein